MEQKAAKGAKVAASRGDALATPGWKAMEQKPTKGTKEEASLGDAVTTSGGNGIEQKATKGTKEEKEGRAQARLADQGLKARQTIAWAESRGAG